MVQCDGAGVVPGNVGPDGQVVGAAFDSGVSDEVREVGRRRRRQLRLRCELATNWFGDDQLFTFLKLCQQSLKSKSGFVFNVYFEPLQSARVCTLLR